MSNEQKPAREPQVEIEVCKLDKRVAIVEELANTLIQRLESIARPLRELLVAMDKPKDAPLCVRDMFAMSALQGLLARSEYHAKDHDLVNYSYKLADTMMEQRRKID